MWLRRSFPVAESPASAGFWGVSSPQGCLHRSPSMALALARGLRSSLEHPPLVPADVAGGGVAAVWSAPEPSCRAGLGTSQKRPRRQIGMGRETDGADCGGSYKGEIEAHGFIDQLPETVRAPPGGQRSHGPARGLAVLALSPLPRCPPPPLTPALLSGAFSSTSPHPSGMTMCPVCSCRRPSEIRALVFTASPLKYNFQLRQTH